MATHSTEMFSCRQKNIVLCIEVLNSRKKRENDASEKKRDHLSNAMHRDEHGGQFMIESSYQKYLEDIMDLDKWSGPRKNADTKNKTKRTNWETRF